MGKTALIMVDIQNDYFDGGLWPLHRMQDAAKVAASVLKDARTAGDLVIHIRHEGAADAPFFRPGSHGAEIHAGVAPLSGEQVVTKHRPNSFHETPLLALLQAAGVTRVRLTGAMAQMCIDATARAARDFGFDVEVVADACAARDAVWNGVSVPADQVHAAFLAALSGTYAKVVTHSQAT